MKLRTKIIIPFIALAVLIIASFMLGSNYLVNVALKPVLPENARDSEYYIPKTPKQIDESDEVEVFTNECREIAYPWLKNNSSVVSIVSFDGLNLKGYLAKTAEPSHKYLIIMHGYRSEPRNVSPYALHFNYRGFNVIVPGQRGHGWSEGDCIDMGAFACRDVKSWCDYVSMIDPEAQIILYGVSMGAATVMLSTGLDLPQNILCAVEDCGYTSAWEQLKYRLELEYNLSSFPMLNGASSIIKSRYGFDLKKVSPVKALKKSKTPTLFIHGTADDYVPFYMLHENYDAAGCEKQILAIVGAKHARAAFKNPEIYWETVDAFTDKYFK